MFNPLVSVIIPAFNAEKYLRESIASVLDQTLQSIEVIIINDGSTDSTEDIIKSFSDARIIYLKNNQNLGIIKTLNKGLECARGKYIARMDADDISMKSRLKRQVEIFENDVSIDIVNIKAFILNEEGTYFKENRGFVKSTPKTMPYLQYLRNMVMHPGVMIKGDILKSFKYRDSEEVIHIEDYELWMRLFKAGYKCFTIDDELLYYRFNPNSISRTKQEEQHKRLISLSAKYLKQDLNLSFSKRSLEYNWGEFNCFEYCGLNDYYKDLNHFITEIRKSDVFEPIDVTALDKFISFKMLAVSMAFVKFGGLRGKINAGIFLIRNAALLPKFFKFITFISRKKKFSC